MDIFWCLIFLRKWKHRHMSDHHKKFINIKDLVGEPGAVGVLSDYKDHTDPKYIGPGTWNSIHRYAYKAKSRSQQEGFINFMVEICQGFPCTVCRGHCTEYIKNHPMEEYLDVLVEINGEKMALGLFVWSWKFHNAVNARIKKPLMSWDTAYNLYSETESLVCSKNCLEAEANINHNESVDGLEHNRSYIPGDKLFWSNGQQQKVPHSVNINFSNLPKLSDLNKSRTNTIPNYFPTSNPTQPFRLIPIPRR